MEIDYKKLFSLYAKTESGEEQKLEAIEERLQHLKRGAPLAYQDLETIANPAYWQFSKYWMWPHRTQIEDKLGRTAGWFVQLPEGEKKIIGRLIDIFKNIVLISIVLRFARPDFYAIYSLPTLRALRIERESSEVDEYLHYVEEMRILRGCFGLSKVGEVDMLVWAIERAKGEYLDLLKRTLAKVLPENLTPGELLVYFSQNPIKLAQEYYKRKDYVTAGFWAAKAFDKFLDDECRHHGIHIPERPHRRTEMIRALCELTTKWSFHQMRNLLYHARKIRNNIVPGVKKIVAEEVEDLIDTVHRLRVIAGHERP